MKGFIIVMLLLGLTTSSFFCENKRKEESKMMGEGVKKVMDLPPPDPAPKVIKKPKAIYPPSAKSSREKGKVIVKVSVGIDGKVFKARAIWSTNNIFEAIAESLAYQYVFETPTFAGKPQAVIFSIPILFDPDSVQVEKK